jgi:hypothetical protein
MYLLGFWCFAPNPGPILIFFFISPAFPPAAVADRQGKRKRTAKQEKAIVSERSVDDLAGLETTKSSQHRFAACVSADSFLYCTNFCLNV